MDRTVNSGAAKTGGFSQLELVVGKGVRLDI